MILSGRDVQWYIETGKLKIEPVQSNQFQQNGVDLVLDAFQREHDNFFLGVTREWIEMPDDLMAFVQLRSTWAREGFMLPPTVVDAGFKGQITLEIVKFGTLAMPVGERFAHLIFAKMTSHSLPYDGKYQGQRGITPARGDE